MLKQNKLLTLLVLLTLMFTIVACGAAEPVAQSEPAQDEYSHAEEKQDDHDHGEEGHDDHGEEGHDDHDEHGHDDHGEEGHDDHDEHGHDDHDDHGHSDEMAKIDFQPVELADGEKLKVVATMNIVGDIVAQVGGDMIDLTVMIGADPHGYTPTPQDIAAVADAHVVFSHGLGIEEGFQMDELLENAGGSAVAVAVAMGVETRSFGEDGEKDDHHDEDHHGEEEHHEGEDHHDEGEHHAEGEDHHDEEEHHDEEHHDEDEHHAEGEEHHDEDEHHEGEDEHGHHHHHGGVDPHAWMIPTNALVFVENIEQTLGQLNPANAEAYHTNAEAYEAELTQLDAEVTEMIAAIPEANRKIVTDHDAFGYYVDRYGLEMVGATIPSYSTLAEPSAQDLAKLQDAIAESNVQAIFVGTTINPNISEQIASDTGIQLVPLYTGSLGEAGSGADTYLDYIRYNTTAIADALK